MANPSVEELEAQLEVAKLEKQLLDAKATASGPSDKLKLDLREARRVHREHRAAREAAPGVAQPEAVTATATVKE